MGKELENLLEDLSKQEIIVKKGIGVYMDGSAQTTLHKTTVGVEFKGHIETLKQASTDKQDLERFTKLIVEKRVDMNLLAIRHNVETYNDDYYTLHNSYDVCAYMLFEEEFNFIKGMIKKYGKSF